MSERFKEPVLKTGDPSDGTVGSNPTLSATFTFVKLFLTLDLEKYPRGRRGSPAKGVGRVERREGSNPSFSAKQKTVEDRGKP